MVLVALTGTTVGTETVVADVVIEIDRCTGPAVMTLDAEMVVTLAGKVTTPCPTLEQSLRQRDTGRYVVAIHLFNSHTAPLVNVLLVLCVPACLCKG